MSKYLPSTRYMNLDVLVANIHDHPMSALDMLQCLADYRLNRTQLEAAVETARRITRRGRASLQMLSEAWAHDAVLSEFVAAINHRLLATQAAGRD